MNFLHTTGRILNQLKHDRRTIALLLLVPILLMGLLAWIFQDAPQVFDQIGSTLLGIFPLVMMFIVTSIATLRERQSGTLERLLTTPLSKGALMLGYALAFGLIAILQAVLVGFVCVYCYGLDIKAPLWTLILFAVLDAILGTALGLLASGFAATEFQAVQFMPTFILPQFLLCGLLMPRTAMPQVLRWVSDVLPLSYAVDAMQEISKHSEPDLGKELLVLGGFVIASLIFASLTLRRRTA